MKPIFKPIILPLVIGFAATVFAVLKLNPADLTLLLSAIGNTILGNFFALLFVFLFAMLLILFNERFGVASYIIRLISSLPQLVWLMLGYAMINIWIVQEGLSSFSIILLLSIVFALVLLPEVYLFFSGLIEHSKQRGVYFALRTLGASTTKTVVREVLWRESRTQLFLKFCGLLGHVFFLQISIEFIISVGLAETVGVINFPTSLGQLLVQIGNKQDLLAVGFTLRNLTYLPELFTQHLFGLTVAACIVVGMISTFKISTFAIRMLNER